MNYKVTRLFIGGLLKGMTHTGMTDVKFTVGFVCRKPIGGSPYKIIVVEEIHMNEQLRLKLLGQVIEGLQDKNRPHSDLTCLNVRFLMEDNDVLTEDVGVVEALDYLHNGVHHFEDFDLNDAERCEVYSL